MLSKLFDSIIKAGLCVIVVCGIFTNSDVTSVNGRGTDWCQNHKTLAKEWAAEISSDLYEEC